MVLLGVGQQAALSLPHRAQHQRLAVLLRKSKQDKG